MEKEKESKKELQINVAFEEKKLEAMTYFMEEKNVTIESAMQDHLNDLYEKYVPSAMRRYLNRNDMPEQQQGGKLETRRAATGQGSTPVKKREDRRQSREQSQSNDAVLAEAQAGEPAEENNQGMSMSM